MFDRISVNPNIHHGQACVKGTRVPVYLIVRLIANGETVEGILEEYPNLKRDDVMACLDYASFAVESQKPSTVIALERCYDMVDLAA